MSKYDYCDRGMTREEIAALEQCPDCDGKGYHHLPVSYRATIRRVQCSRCGGKGFIRKEPKR